MVDADDLSTITFLFNQLFDEENGIRRTFDLATGVAEHELETVLRTITDIYKLLYIRRERGDMKLETVILQNTALVNFFKNLATYPIVSKADMEKLHDAMTLLMTITC